MKYPKLKQRVLCQLTVGLPIILLILIPLLLVLLAGVTVCVFIGGLVLACVYLFCNISTLFFLDIALSTVHSMENERLEYRTEQNGTTRDEIAHAILSRCRSWGTQLPGQSDDNLLFYLHKPSFMKFYSGYQYRVVVRSVPQVAPDTYRLYRTQATQLMRQAPVGTSAWWQTRQEKEQPVCKADVLILLADTVAPACKSLPYQDQALRVCLVECATGKYYMNSELESYEQGVMPSLHRTTKSNCSTSSYLTITFPWNPVQMHLLLLGCSPRRIVFGRSSPGLVVISKILTKNPNVRKRRCSKLFRKTRFKWVNVRSTTSITVAYISATVCRTVTIPSCF